MPRRFSILLKATGDVDKDISEHSLAIPGTHGAGYIATLLPVDRGQRRGIVAPFAASVAVFVQDPVDAPLLPGEAFARLYKLTGGELRVLLALAQGLGAKEAADMLGISEPTVRTHLQHIFSKTLPMCSPLWGNAPPRRSTDTWFRLPCVSASMSLAWPILKSRAIPLLAIIEEQSSWPGPGSHSTSSPLHAIL